MEAVGRRVFIGSLVGSLPLLAADALPAFGTQTEGEIGANRVRGTRSEGAPDAVIDHALRELGHVHVRARRRQRVIGEDARAAAAQFRGLAVYVTQQDWDARAREAVRRVVAKEGRERVLAAQLDPASARKALKKYGFEDEPWHGLPAPDYAARSQALDDVLQRGPSAILGRTAGLLEQVGDDLDRRGAQAASVQRVVQSWNDGFCEQIAVEIQRLGMSLWLIQQAERYYPRLWWASSVVGGAILFQGGFYLYYCSRTW